MGETMKKYSVSINLNSTLTYEVEAENKDQARKYALAMFQDPDIDEPELEPDYGNPEVCYIGEIS
jgi:hypothetical protein